MSERKFQTQMARGWAMLMDHTGSKSNMYDYEAKFEAALHEVMGFYSHLGDPDLEF